MSSNKVIEEGNRLIAEFMGLKTGMFPYALSYTDTLMVWGKDVPKSLPKYDTLWDWLMPVVEKIEAIKNSDDYEVDIFGNCCDIGGKIEKVGKTKIEAVWLAVIDFIQSSKH